MDLDHVGFDQIFMFLAHKREVLAFSLMNAATCARYHFMVLCLLHMHEHGVAGLLSMDVLLSNDETCLRDILLATEGDSERAVCLMIIYRKMLKIDPDSARKIALLAACRIDVGRSSWMTI